MEENKSLVQMAVDLEKLQKTIKDNLALEKLTGFQQDVLNLVNKRFAEMVADQIIGKLKQDEVVNTGAVQELIQKVYQNYKESLQ